MLAVIAATPVLFIGEPGEKLNKVVDESPNPHGPAE
jgi:hypothetical protein